jgi:hypothetical protein
MGVAGRGRNRIRMVRGTILKRKMRLLLLQQRRGN